MGPVGPGSVMLVTGAAGGIGRAVAARMRADGATVVGSDLPGAGAEVELDVRDIAAVRSAIAGIVTEHGTLTAAVACAGIGVGGPAEEVADDAWSRSIDVNLVGALNTVRAAYEVMIPLGRGSLVAIASLAGLLPTPLLVPYATAKAGVVAFMTSLRPEAARHGIGVSVVCPGPVDTDFLRNGGAHGSLAGVDTHRYLTDAAGPAISAAAVADAVVKAIRRDRALVAPKRARLLHLLARVAPGPTERVVARAMAKELARS